MAIHQPQFSRFNLCDICLIPNNKIVSILAFAKGTLVHFPLGKSAPNHPLNKAMAMGNPSCRGNFQH